MLQFEHEYLLCKANNLLSLLQSASYLFDGCCRSVCVCRLAGSGQSAYRTFNDSSFVFQNGNPGLFRLARLLPASLPHSQYGHED